ncbi:LPS export ABC transporter periplasmic protein LptC [Psychromonas sp. SP041]|uniref:LPS export ABC transporter periplasmic protein LptC n=1 Tax=Psychromonas sp. SP041 TaxID=1365007 RepID=UPI0003F97166|nr:LPS export ABC transporter periplasmic protein LptC [Psychromonas sp. SP041]
MNKRQSIPFIALLIAFIAWIYVKPDVEFPSLPDHHPSYIADDVKSHHYDEFGFNDYRVFAEKMTNYPETDTTFFENPKIIFYTKDKNSDSVTTWQLTSVEGTLTEKYNLLLSGDVLVENLSKDQLVQTMSTAQATVQLDSKEITSSKKVTWTGPQVKQEGVGLWASMVTEEMKLNSNIKAVYLNEPK